MEGTVVGDGRQQPPEAEPGRDPALGEEAEARPPAEGHQAPADHGVVGRREGVRKRPQPQVPQGGHERKGALDGERGAQEDERGAAALFGRAGGGGGGGGEEAEGGDEGGGGVEEDQGPRCAEVEDGLAGRGGAVEDADSLRRCAEAGRRDGGPGAVGVGCSVQSEAGGGLALFGKRQLDSVDADGCIVLIIYRFVGKMHDPCMCVMLPLGGKSAAIPLQVQIHDFTPPRSDGAFMCVWQKNDLIVLKI